jgi:hypothetical protein
MPIPSSAGCAVLREVVSALEGSDLKYWVGRGVFRHYRVAREFGDKQNDIDLHVLEAEREKVVGLVGHLCERGYERVPWNDRGYKIPLVKGMVPVELIFLEGKIGGLSSVPEGWVRNATRARSPSTEIGGSRSAELRFVSHGISTSLGFTARIGKPRRRTTAAT